jgi:hypothetical protein
MSWSAAKARAAKPGPRRETDMPLIWVGDVPADLQRMPRDRDDEEWERDLLEAGRPEAVVDLAVADAPGAHNLHVTGAAELTALARAFGRRRPTRSAYPTEALLEGFRRRLYDPLPSTLRAVSQEPCGMTSRS